MLVMARKVGETIRIGENVFIKVVAAKNGRIRIGIEAPREIGITRSGSLGAIGNDRKPNELMVCENQG